MESLDVLARIRAIERSHVRFKFFPAILVCIRILRVHGNGVMREAPQKPQAHSGKLELKYGAVPCSGSEKKKPAKIFVYKAVKKPLKLGFFPFFLVAHAMQYSIYVTSQPTSLL